MTLEQIMQEGCDSLARMVDDSNALNRAWRQGRYSDELARIRKQVLDGDRDNDGTADAPGNDAGSV